MWARFSLSIAATAISMAALASLTPSHLRCEYLTNPLGINETVPRLSWIVASPEKNQRQTGYRILVATSAENLKKGVGDLWDSGDVASDDTVDIEYKGKPLAAGQRAWWTVEVKDRDGKTSKWANAAFWEKGLDASDWKAKWIGRKDPDRLALDTEGAKWIWYPEGNPAVEAPAGDRHFRYRFGAATKPVHSRLAIAVDDSFVLWVNGHAVASGSGWRAYTEYDLTNDLRAGDNVIDIIGHNGAGRAGMLAVGSLQIGDTVINFHTDKAWETSIDGQNWQPSMEVADLESNVFHAPQSVHGADTALYLTGGVTLAPHQVVRARAYVSAKGLYHFFVDGHRVGADIFTPGWTDYRKRIQYQTYDVTDLLKNGTTHSLSLVVGDGWYCGHVGLAGRENYGPKPMGLCQVEVEYDDGSRGTYCTDDSWRVGQGPILTNDLLMGENYDARRPTFGMLEPVDVQALDAAPLVGQHSPTVQKLQELKPIKMTEPTPGHYVFDLGQNMVGWARLKVRGPSGDTITLRFAEMLNPDGTIYTTNLRSAKCTDTYICAGGNETYEPSFTFHGFRYVELTGYPGKPGMDAVTGIVVGSNNPKTGSFECSNPMVNQLQHNIFWGQRGNYLEVPTDCPQRDERLGWMGDAQIFARTATFNNDIAAFMTKWTQDVEDAQSPEGGFSDVSPRIGDLSDGAPAWGDAGVIVPWTMYLAYGDTRLLERRYDAMKAWIDYIDSVNPDHIWIKRSNNNFGDWLNVHDDTPRDVIATAYFAHSTDLFARIARVLGRDEDAAKYEALRDEIRKAFVEHFVDADVKIKGDTQTCYVLALWFDLLPDDMRPAAAKRLRDHIMIDRQGHLSTGFVGVGYLCPTLSSLGMNDVAYTLLNQDTYPSWGYSIKHGATTIWERWDGWTEEHGFQDPGMNSFNHYSLGSVGEWMASHVAGIDLDPKQPGYKHILIHPEPGGGMTWAKGSYDSIRGTIASSWKIADGKIAMEITIPANTTATVTVPTGDPAGVSVDGKKMSSASFELGSGHYTITATVK
ncbi:MAG TPA: family 78 glycoside hydrolase catalytic domain [Fimbriimonadaceae bacterium]|nr:family 78 glycoside hydrolase catalytic domain [Fimbriimonadaceae bacterium]